MVKLYVTFGQLHKHKHDHRVVDKDTVAVVLAPTLDKAYSYVNQLFGTTYANVYTSDTEVGLEHYPKGLVYYPPLREIDTLGIGGSHG